MVQVKNTNNVVADKMSQQPALVVLQDWLDSYLNFEITPKKNIFWLKTMEYLCQRLHEPQMAYKKIHVAGSKGKGSVSSMIASVLDLAGQKTGLYSSPHILDFSERVSTPNGPFEESIYEKSVLEIMHSVDPIILEQLPGERPITWFELVTMFAFLTFKNAGCDWAVFETGLGGRLDATNIILPEISVITPIELEHTDFLGDTIEKIAAEKAGIIKNQIPVCIGFQSEEAEKVLINKAKECGSKYYLARELITNCKSKFHKNCTEIYIESPLFARPVNTKLKLMGSFQAHNAALAALTLKILFPEMDEAIIEEGLARTHLMGRFEITGNQEYPVVLDGAHTPRSIGFTLETFKALTDGNISKAHLLFACAADKHVEEMAELLQGFASITLTKPGETKGADTGRMQKAFTEIGIEYTYTEDYNQAIENAIKKAEQAKVPLLVTGSFYLIAEVKAHLNANISL